MRSRIFQRRPPPNGALLHYASWFLHVAIVSSPRAACVCGLTIPFNATVTGRAENPASLSGALTQALGGCVMDSRFALAIFSGVLTYLALLAAGYVFAQVAFPGVSPPWPLWYAVSHRVIEALAAVAPGFIGGWVACRSGAAVGAAVAIISALFTPFAVSLTWVGIPALSSSISLIAAIAAGGVITGAVAGAAGHLLHVRGAAP